MTTLQATPTDPEGVPQSAYCLAATRAQHALAERVRCAGDIDHPALPAAESLELLRATLHREIDDAVDLEALRHPSARRIIARVPRYRDLLDWLEEAA